MPSQQTRPSGSFSTGGRLTPTRRCRGGPHGGPLDPRERVGLESDSGAGQSPPTPDAVLSSSEERRPPSPQRCGSSSPPPSIAREVPTFARRSRPAFRAERGSGASGHAASRPRRMCERLRARARLSDRGAPPCGGVATVAVDCEVRVEAHGPRCVRSGWSTPRPSPRGPCRRREGRGADPGARAGGSGRRSSRRTRLGVCPAAPRIPRKYRFGS